MQFVVTILFFVIYNSFDGMQVGGILYDIIGNFQIWLIILLTTVTCVLPYVIYRRWEVLFYDDIINNLRHDKYQQDYNKKTYKKKIEAVTKYTRSIAKFRKIFNKQDDFEPENLADKKIKAVVDGFRSSKRKQKNINTNLINNPIVNPLFNNEDINNNIIDNIEYLASNNNFFNDERINYRKYSNVDERERAISLENNIRPISNQKIKTKNSGSIYNINNNIENSNLNNHSDKQNMNINTINNNIVNPHENNNNQISIDPQTHTLGANGSQPFRYSGAGNPQNHMNNTSYQPFKNKSSSNTNIQNSSSNNYNYNYIHPYDEEELINEHLGGKFKPITTTGIGRVLNQNESYEKDYKIISRENNKFEFNFKTFKNTSNNLNSNNNINNNNFANGTLANNNNFDNLAENINTNILNSNGLDMDANNDDNFNDNNIYNQDLIENNANVNFNDFGNLEENENLNSNNNQQLADDIIVAANFKKTTDFYDPNNNQNVSKRKLIQNEKIQSRSESKKSDSKTNSSKNVSNTKKDLNSKFDFIFFHQKFY